jgi:hypothetical protein
LKRYQRRKSIGEKQRVACSSRDYWSHTVFAVFTNKLISLVHAEGCRICVCACYTNIQQFAPGIQTMQPDNRHFCEGGMIHLLYAITIRIVNLLGQILSIGPFDHQVLTASGRAGADGLTVRRSWWNMATLPLRQSTSLKSIKLPSNSSRRVYCCAV